MATLSETDRDRVWRGLMRYWSSSGTEIPVLTKTDLRDTVVATDNWIDSNQASYNNALPAVAQSNLTVSQKTILFCVVALARVSISFLRSILGEVE